MTTSVPSNAALIDADGYPTLAFRDFLRGLQQGGANVGDYKQTACADIGDGWLLCDGSTVSQSVYSDLYKVLQGITAPGASPGTFKLPGIAAVYDPASPEPNGTPVMSTWIKAR